MSSVTCQMSMSLDGYVAGPNQSMDHPIGEGGMGLHGWALATAAWREQHGGPGGERNADAEVVDAMKQGIGTYIMGEGCSAAATGRGTSPGRGGGARIRRTTRRSSCSRTIPANR